jgi:hypothetical protein
MTIAPTAAQSDAELTARASALVGTVTERRDLSGMIAWQTGTGTIQTVTFGYADWQSGTRFGPQTRFPAPQLGQALILDLANRELAAGRLSLADPIPRYLPERSEWSGQTVGALMGRIQAQDYAAEHEYAALAAIVEQSARARIETLSAAVQLSPFGLESSQLTSAVTTDAIGYRPGPHPLGLMAVSTPVPNAPALVTTVPDLIALGRLVQSRRLDLFRPDGQMNAGWETHVVNGRVVYEADSWAPGFRAGVLIDPTQDRVLAYALNIESYPAIMFDGLMLYLLLDGTPSLPERPDTAALEPGHLEAAGAYHSVRLGAVTLLPSAGGMSVVLPDSARQDYLTPIGADRLFWRRIGAELVYERDAVGRVTALSGTWLGPVDSPTLRLERTDLPALPDDAAEPAED